MESSIGFLKEKDYDNAIKMFSNELLTGFSVEKAIVGAVIEDHYQMYDDEFEMISNGLKIDNQNCILFYLLGNYYAKFNKSKALLSYKNARYYYGIHGVQDNDLADVVFMKKPLKAIEEAIAEVKDYADVRDISIIIISYNTYQYTKKCIQSIRATCDQDVEIIVVDNNSVDGSLEWLRNQKDVLLIENENNVGFPKGCNQGIMKAKESNDIFLLNSDTCLLTNSLFYLRLGLYDSDKNGEAGSITNYAGNYQSVEFRSFNIDDAVGHFVKYNYPMKNPYEMKTYLIGFALLIRRTALDNVGVLDERFTPGNYEDNDLGLRMLKAGYRNVLVHNSFIVHYGSKSFLKNVDEYRKISEQNRQKFCDKWGFNPTYFNWIRTDLIELLDAERDNEIKVLEIGCGFGDTLSRIKYMFHNAEIHGIEIVKNIANLACAKANVIYGDITVMNLPFEKKYFDYIIIGDVLEHLIDPVKVLRMLADYLRDGGKIISSIPNMMNAKVIYDLLHGDFEYQDAGILDRTHLRFFTHKSVMELFTNGGYEIESLVLKVDPNESTSSFSNFFDQLLKIDGVCERGIFDAYQFLIRAKIKR